MKAISIKQPWANLIVAGKKTIETRVWSTSYRGEILIVSSRMPNIVPAGFALAIAELVDCRKMTMADTKAAMCDVYPNAVSWFLQNVRPIKPLPIKGQLGIYETTVTLDSLEFPQ